MADKNVVLLKSVILVRDGKRVSPPLNKAFPLTADELKSLKDGTHYRAAINEDAQASEAELQPLARSPGTAEPQTNGKGAGTTTAMANGMDGTNATNQQDGDANTDQRLNANVTDVTATVNAITDKADLAALREAETKGKNRAGVLGAIDARVKDLTPADDDL